MASVKSGRPIGVPLPPEERARKSAVAKELVHRYGFPLRRAARLLGVSDTMISRWAGGVPTRNKTANISGGNNANWKGGIQNWGSVAHAANLLRASRRNKERHGWYQPLNETPESLSAKMLAHPGPCDCCGDPEPKKRCVDHCHETGRYRGIVCARCNNRLVALDADGWLAQAQKYLSERA